MTNLPDHFKRAIADLQRRNVVCWQLLAGILADRQADATLSELALRAAKLKRLSDENRRDYLRLQAEIIDWELSQTNYTPLDKIVIPDFLPDDF